MQMPYYREALSHLVSLARPLPPLHFLQTDVEVWKYGTSDPTTDLYIYRDAGPLPLVQPSDLYTTRFPLPALIFPIHG